MLMTIGIKESPIDFKIAEGRRTTERQLWLHASGRSRMGKILTYRDGVNKVGKHQKGEAVDIVPWINGKEDWKNEKAFIEIGKHLTEVAKTHKLPIVWGGKWKMKDLPHYETV